LRGALELLRDMPSDECDDFEACCAAMVRFAAAAISGKAVVNAAQELAVRAMQGAIEYLDGPRLLDGIKARQENAIPLLRDLTTAIAALRAGE